MFIVTGAYYWWPKTVGFRNDYCLTCNADRRAVRIRTFDVGHIFWIPILPVGFWKHWYCTACHSDPHASPRTRPFFKWAGLLILVAMSIGFWVDPAPPDDVAWYWAFRIGAPLCAILLLLHLLKAPRQPSLKARLATIALASDTLCPFCTTPMISGDRWSCPACGVVRY